MLKNILKLNQNTEDDVQLPLFDVKSDKRLKIEVYIFSLVFLLTLIVGVTKKYNLMNFWQRNLIIDNEPMNIGFKTIEPVEKRSNDSNTENKFIELYNQNIDGDSFDVIDITLRSKADITQGYISWKNEKDDNWKIEKSFYFDVGEVVRPIYHKHFSINVGEHSLWKGKIDQLRFNFPQKDNSSQIVKASIHRDYFLKLLNMKYKRILIFIILMIFTILILYPSSLKIFFKDDTTFSKDKVQSDLFFIGLIFLFGFVSLIPFDVYPHLRFYLSSVPLTLPSIMLIFLVFLFVVIKLLGKEPLKNFKLNGFEISFIFLLIASFISFKNAEFVRDSKILMIQFFIPTFLFCFFLIRFLSKESYFYRLIHWGLFFSTFSAAYSLAEYFFNNNVLFDRYLITYNPFLATFSNYGPSYGTFIHPNVFGSYLIIFIPFSIFIFLSTNNPTWKMYGFICSFIQILGLFASRSWGSFVSLIAICIIMLFKIEKRIFKTLVILVLCIVIITIGIHFKPYRDYIKRAKEIGLNAPPFNTPEFEIYNRKHWHEIYRPNYYSVYSRELMFKYIMRILEKYPFFGLGLNNFVPRFYEFTDVVGVYLEQGPIINNQYIMLLGETGLIGFSSFLFMLFFIFRKLFQKSRNVNSAIEKTFIFFCGISITGFLLNIIFYDGFYWWAPNFCFFLITMSIFTFSKPLKSESSKRI